MKKYSKYFVVAMSTLAFAFSTGTLIKVNATPAAAAAVPAQPVDLTYAAEKSLPSVVHILSTKNSKVQTVEVENDPFSDFFSDPFGFFGNPQGNGGKQRRSVRTPKQQGSGSGVIISADGYIVTNNHVVADADELTVTLNDNKEYSARIIGTDKASDLALIKIDGKNLPAITIANSDDIKVGEWVLAVGNPFNLTNTVTAGIVSAKARSLYQNGVESFIQTDAAINPGNSGGALVNTRGELIGINAMLYSQTGSFSGYGFAIPTSIMNKVVADLKQYGTVQRALIGIQGQDVKNYVDAKKDKGEDIDLGTMEGIYVAKVTEESAAEEAGMKEGDVITAIDGKPVNKMAELQEVLAKKRPGDKVTVTYLRDKKKATKTVTLKNEKGNTQVVKKADLDVLGGNFRAITNAQKEQLNIGYGLEVLKVNSGRLKTAGITKGFIIQRVNDNAVKTIDDLQNAVKEASTSKDPVLYIQGVYPTGKKAYFAVPLED
ncbi:Do family serine endopeptidase [Leyella stercorea]|jgi:serine protease Do|uniref:Putative serine protease MucD n=3 Tax=Leyella stercorea TaxID=363265 RepID=G6AYR7_9BACT|nr:Do family serine endopeptidase [Leyella stercorea]EHJ39071.1 putative serine protease MucD [Leyella stercorea DSM 18206]MBD8938331.1 Do family serine endopeptidase [Leyella stercorea]MBD8938669.1 Do family serine endopeptidase [Leyella stercorea]MBL6516555.1 Do family serine endopeptidase [Leyella stercorea]